MPFKTESSEKRRAEGDGSRADDAYDVAKIRLGLFKQNTLPMLKYLDEKSKLKVVRAKMRVRKQLCILWHFDIL